jgi:hypothetical protein
MEAINVYLIIFLIGLVIGLIYAMSFMSRLFGGGAMMMGGGGYLRQGHRGDGGAVGLLMLLATIAAGAVAYIAYERYNGADNLTAHEPKTEWEEFLYRYDGDAEEEEQPELEFELDNHYDPEDSSPGQLEKDWQERLRKARQQGRISSDQNDYDDYTEYGDGEWTISERPPPAPPKPYYIQLASSSSQQAALEEATKAAARYKIDAWLGIGDTRYAQAYKVLLGPFATAEEAKAAQKRLKTDGFVKNAQEEGLEINALQK